MCSLNWKQGNFHPLEEHFIIRWAAVGLAPSTMATSIPPVAATGAGPRSHLLGPVPPLPLSHHRELLPAARASHYWQKTAWALWRRALPTSSAAASPRGTGRSHRPSSWPSPKLQHGCDGLACVSVLLQLFLYLAFERIGSSFWGSSAVVGSWQENPPVPGKRQRRQHGPAPQRRYSSPNEQRRDSERW